MKQNMFARLGTTWLPFIIINSSVLQKFNVLSFLLYLSHTKVLSNHIFCRNAPSNKHPPRHDFRAKMNQNNELRKCVDNSVNSVTK